MKNIQKLFKKREEDTLDMHTLSTVSHTELCQLVLRFHTELKDAGHHIESSEEQIKQLKKDLNNSIEQAQLYKNHCEDLQNFAQKSSMESDSYKTLLESKTQEVKYFRDKNVELEKISESVKNLNSILAELESLRQKNKEMNEKIVLMTSEKELHTKEKTHYENEIRSFKDRQDEVIKKYQDCENLLKQKSEEYFKVKADNKSLKQNVKELDKVCKEMEAVVKGKSHRILELETQCNGMVTNLQEFKEKINTLEIDHETEKDELKKELKEKTAQLEIIHDKMDKETAAKIEEINSNLMKSLEDYKIKITSLEIERSNYSSTIQKLNNEISDLQCSLKTTQEDLELSQKKRELAKEELIKLTQKFENMSNLDRPSNKTTQSLVNQSLLLQRQVLPGSIQEHKALQILKFQLDTVYKALMELMLSANTTRDSMTNSIQYSITSEDFSRFEKDLNKVVMNAKEAAENPNFIDQGPGWMGKISNWAPSKFFSCMNHEDRLNVPNPPEKRRSSYKGFF
ncbi:hypothetical protein SteCoe_24091 [Stentor coeruleus]|uniref:Uncharacterized protein n=1 Tax=Stentor coeruleus TaxID=5963 RepID=A0A1R2BIS6_9CILI|nr:hypothetical protein SteCoe_24091 [Stentor coeruleus]